MILSVEEALECVNLVIFDEQERMRLIREIQAAAELPEKARETALLVALSKNERTRALITERMTSGPEQTRGYWLVHGGRREINEAEEIRGEWLIGEGQERNGAEEIRDEEIRDE